MNYEINFNGFSFNFNKGDFILVAGSSASGKTSFLLECEKQLNAIGQKTGFVFQNFDSQIVTDKVWHELAFGLENAGTPRALMERRIAEMASYFGITSWFERETDTLSGGQKQILNLAGTMVLTPDFLLLDEPVSQLDPIAASNFLNTVKKLNRELGTTVIIAEHRLEDIFADATKVLVLDKMLPKFKGSPEEVCTQIFNSKEKEFIEILPAAARVFYQRIQQNQKIQLTQKIPLTIAQGRQWLETLSVKQNNFEPDKENLTKKLLVRAKNISFKYEKNSPFVLHNLSLDIAEGEILAVAGVNGSGKSTLLKILTSILKPLEGKLKIESETKDKIFMLSQNVRNSFTKTTVRAELTECGWNEHDLQKIGSLAQKLESHPYDLSGGEMQKLALIKILLKNPKILLLDEPTKGLDNSFKKELSSTLKKLAQNKMSIVLVCHDLEFCAYTADKVSLLFNGNLVGTDFTRTFFAQNSFYTTPVNRMVRGLWNSSEKTLTETDLCFDAPPTSANSLSPTSSSTSPALPTTQSTDLSTGGTN